MTELVQEAKKEEEKREEKKEENGNSKASVCVDTVIGSNLITSSCSLINTPSVKVCSPNNAPEKSESRDSTPPQPVQDFSLREKVGAVKKKTFDTNEIVTIGEPWKMIELINYFKTLILNAFFEINKSKYMLFVFPFFSLCLLGSCAICILSFVEFMNDSDMLAVAGVAVLTAGFGIIAVVFMVYQMSKFLRKQWISNDLVRTTFCIHVITVCFGFILAAALYSEHDIYSLSMLLLNIGAGVLYLLVLAGILVGFPFLCIGFAVEATIRLCKCSLNCPKHERMRKNFQYQLFNYTSKAFGNCECVICLDNLKENEQVILLECHMSHIFHENCIMEWMEKSLGCPVCRKEIAFVLN
eukprot:TRINITY_DN12653_c0_g2_i5.p1 TRINITY_DN12653_c0_g2~~TRINITY_DN12653_c0_g2_i5.p1  ORF type:complete len:355 (+),score=80.59 TRINITY_DN12653_c0_g2_i5:53-1117(+)